MSTELINDELVQPWGVAGGDPEESPAAALNSFLRAIGRHRVTFAAVILLCLLGATVWLAHRTPSYEATAEILVSPVPANDNSFVGLPLIRASELEPQRAAATAAPLLESRAVARLTAARLHASGPSAITSKVTVAPLANSSLVEITAKADSADGATALANTYADTALGVRDRFLIPQVRGAIANTKAQLSLLADPFGAEANALNARLADLSSILNRGDPTLALGRPAPSGTSQNSPAKLVLVIALLAGIVLASLTVVMAELLAPRPIDAESELSRLYPLPVLARTPEVGSGPGSDFRRPLNDAPAAVREGFRALRGQLELRADAGPVPSTGQGSTVLLVSPGNNDCRIASSLNLARAFASVHDRATVVELDVRNPKMASILRVDPSNDISSLLSGASVESVAISPNGSGGIQLIAAPPAIDLSTREALTTRSVEIVDEARRLGDWVVIDAPPITEAAADAVAALPAADHVVVVVRLGSTRPEALGLLREFFEQRGVMPDGYLVVVSGSSGWRLRSDSGV